MSKKRRAQELMAASLYEPLDEAEQAELEACLKARPALADEYASLRRFKEALPASRIPFEGDLRPALREDLRRTPARTGRFRPLVPAVLCAALLVLLLQPVLFQAITPETPGMEPVPFPRGAGHGGSPNPGNPRLHRRRRPA